MNAGNASRERIRGIEYRGVRVGELGAFAQQRGIHGSRRARRFASRQQVHGRSRPHGPLPEQAAVEGAHFSLAAHHDRERSGQIVHDAVVVAGIQRDVIAPRFRDPANRVNRAIAIERRDLHCPHILDLRELAPELIAEHASADRGLEIEAEQWNHLGHRAAMPDQFRVRRIRKCREAEQSHVVAERLRNRRLGLRLTGLPDEPGDVHERSRILRERSAYRFRRQLEHRPVHPVPGIANCELRGVHTHGDASSARVHVIPRERALTPLVERPARSQCQRVRGNHHTRLELRPCADHRRGHQN